MAEPAVINASPLIHLAEANRLGRLQGVTHRVVVPKAVADELRQKGSLDPTVKALEATAWLSVGEVSATPSAVASWDLGPGESAVLTYALSHPGSEAIIDDLMARKCAETLNIPVRGTLGIVLKAKKDGRIEAARPVLVELRNAGMYLSDGILDAALSLVGE